MTEGEKKADSIIKFLVFFETECFKPPEIPAKAMGSFSSAITKQSDVNFNSFSPRISIVSFGFANRTSMFPFILSRSNTCMGWPLSNMTKLIMSTSG